MAQDIKKSNEKNIHYVTFRSDDAKNFGLYAAILKAELERYYERLSCNEEIFEKECIDGWFHVSNESLMERTTLTYKQILRELKTLEHFKIIKKKIRGSPVKRYLKIVFKGGE